MREDVRQNLTACLERVPGRCGVYYENLATGEQFLSVHGQDGDVFETASVIKLWILSCLYEEFARGNLRPEQTLTLRAEDQVPASGLADYRADQAAGNLTGDMFPESGILNCMSVGTEWALEDLAKLMTLISDNTATNILIDLLGIGRINEHIRSLGMTETTLIRRLFDTDPAGLGRENHFSLREAGDWFRLLHREELVSPEACGEMRRMLLNQQNTCKIPFWIGHLPIAHKTGEDLGIENDVGIVYAKEPFILCYASNGTAEPVSAAACQDIAKMLEQ